MTDAAQETGAVQDFVRPVAKIVDFPAAVWIGVIVLASLILLGSLRFDPSRGTLTLSLLVVISFIGVVVYCLLYTIPRDETTSTVIGGLVAAFGAIVAYWLGKSRDGGP